jgi:uncharacterized membrane protein
MLKKISTIEKMLLLCIGFTMCLLLARILYTQQHTYIFYVWNTFLAVMPLLFSRQLDKQAKLNFKTFSLLAAWLLFFPNAAYIITDLFHYTHKPPVPKWYDLFLVISAAFNGLLLGIVSLMQVEFFLQQHIKSIWVKLCVFSSMLLCGYGIYIGRFLRFNSWNVVTKPTIVLHATASHVWQPIIHWRIWCFTVLFAAMFSVIYFTLKAVGKVFTTHQNHSNETFI